MKKKIKIKKKLIRLFYKIEEKVFILSKNKYIHLLHMRRQYLKTCNMQSKKLIFNIKQYIRFLNPSV